MRRPSRCSATWASATSGSPGSAGERASAAPEAQPARPLPPLELAVGTHRAGPDRRRDLGLGVRLLSALAKEPPEEERGPAPDVHPVLVPLDRRDRFPLELAHVGAELRSEPAPAVGLDLRDRGRLEELV